MLHIADEPLDLRCNDALRPGSDLTQLTGLADAVYFTDNDYEDDLRRAHCITPSEELAADDAWKVIRNRELGVKHKKTPGARLGMSDLMPGLASDANLGVAGHGGNDYIVGD